MSIVAWTVGTALAVAGPADVRAESAPQAKRAISAASGHALQGDIRGALAELNSVPAAEFGDKDRAIRNCIIARFEAGSQESHERVSGTTTDRALGLYRAYWRASLLLPETRGAQEARLMTELRSLLNLSPDAQSGRVEAELRARMTRDGYHVLLGRTPPLMEFIAWRSEDSQLRLVQLPEGSHPVRLKVLDDFASLGWSAYATCDRSFTGGWVKPDAIYAVRPGWKDLGAENFQVSFLAHETQHFADKKRFGDMESWELEYRAKLAELALAGSTLPRLLSAFSSNQKGDPTVPHSYANRIVLSWLVSELAVPSAELLTDVAPASVRKAAKALLARDTASRKAGQKRPPPSPDRPNR